MSSTCGICGQKVCKNGDCWLERDSPKEVYDRATKGWDKTKERRK